jgi:hypothetical protein
MGLVQMMRKLANEYVAANPNSFFSKKRTQAVLAVRMGLVEQIELDKEKLRKFDVDYDLKVAQA